MELRARFDEQNNIEWAERLEEAGCTVIYGSEGFKCHSKVCQITYREGMSLTRLTLLGTGNFNEKTAKLYSDFMLMTAHPGIGEDANLFFRNLSLGNLKGDYRYLGVAPAGLKPLILRGLNREIERAQAGQPARVFFKLNSLTDREVIDKISEASRAGVQVQMIIRGISCLLPGIEGKTDGVHIRSIVGRFLEHARIYSFGVDSDTIYLSSADMMTRNTEHRVEIAYPVLDPACRALVQRYVKAQLKDNVKARVLSPSGEWVPVTRGAGEAPFNSQEYLLARAYRDADEAASKRESAPVVDIPDDSPAAMAQAEAELDAAETSAVEAQTLVASSKKAGAPAGARAQATARGAGMSAGLNESASPMVSTEGGAAAVPQAAPTAPQAEAVAAAAPQTAAAAGIPVKATIVEPEPESQAESAPRAATVSSHGQQARPKAAAKKTLARRQPGRFKLGLGLIGMGIKTLITGKTK